MLTNGSRVLKKRRYDDLAEDGTLKIVKRRDAGIKRGHKEGSLPHFLQEQSSQRAGEKLTEPTEFDSHVQDAMRKCRDEPLNPRQKKLEKKAQKKLKTVLDRHEEMIKPVSEKMKKKLDDHVLREKVVVEKSWCQQMSFDSQQQANRFLNLTETRWMATEKEDRDTIRKFCQDVSKTVAEFLGPQEGHTIWCIENTDVFRGGLTSDTLKEALRTQPVLFAAVLFGGYVVDRAWLKKAEEVFQMGGSLVEPHWRLKGAVRKPLELFVDDSFRYSNAHYTSIIRKAQSDAWVISQNSVASGALLSHWTVRDHRKEIHKPTQGIVLYENGEKARENAKKKKPQQKEIDKWYKKVKALRAKLPKPTLKLQGATLKWKKALKSAEKMKGSPVSPKEFIKMISKMVELRKVG